MGLAGVTRLNRRAQKFGGNIPTKMVTRKVARSKRDAMAMAETQLHESESDKEDENKAKSVDPKRRRVSKAESMAIARAAKAEKVAKAKAAAAQQDMSGKAVNRPTSGGISSSGSMTPETTPVVRPPPVAVPVTTTAPPTASSAATTPRASIGTRNGGSRRVTPTSVAASIRDGVVPVAFLRDELERKLQFIDPSIQARFGQLVWAKRAAFPYWPALILDPRLLPDHELPSALKELDEKCWVQLFGSRDIRQILFSALAAWDDKTHPYRDGFPRGDFNRLARLKDTFAVALDEASEQEKLTASERLKVFTTEVVPSLGLPLVQAPLTGFRKRRKALNGPTPGTPPAPASGVASSTADGSSTTQLSQANGLSHKAAKPASTEVERRKRITQEIRGGEPKSRYRLGQLSDYAAKLRSILENQSPERDWRVQLHISQLLDEKAFLREDLEKAGIWELLDQLRGNEDVRWRDLVDTVWNHLTNCTLDEWPSLQRIAPSPNSIPLSRPASTPLLGGAKRGSTDSTRERTGGSTTTQVSSTEISVGDGRSTVEAMAEAVARSMISRSTAMPQSAFRMANLAPRSGTVTNTTTSSPPPSQVPLVSSSSTPSQAPFLSSSSAMTSVGINPGVPDTVPVGTLLFAVPAAPVGTSVASSTPSSSQQQSEKRMSSQPTATRQPTGSSGRASVPTSAPARGTARATHRRSSSPATSPMVSAPTPQSMLRDGTVSRSNPSLVIFNKDGTLLEFQTTWASWIESQAWRLGTALGASVRESFFDGLGYNEPTRTMRKGGVFNTTPKHELGPKFAVNFLLKYGLEYAEAVRLVNQHWSLPKEVATFRARRDLPSLFTTIRELGVKIAILTTDRRAITSKTLTHLGVAHLVDLVSCGDDGVANTSDRIWSICSRLGVSTANTVMVGDTADDMVLGRTAGCALSVGVLGGASDLAELSAHADFLVPCVTNVIKLLYQYRHQAATL